MIKVYEVSIHAQQKMLTCNWFNYLLYKLALNFFLKKNVAKIFEIFHEIFPANKAHEILQH